MMGSVKASESLVGVVVRAGTMDKVVKVRRAKQKFDTFLKKYFTLQPAYFITDPHNSLRTGDIVRFAPWPYYRGTSKRVRHIVTELVQAFGPVAGERPPVPDAAGREALVRTLEERVAAKRRARAERKWAEKEAKRAEKEVKRAEKGAKRPVRRLQLSSIAGLESSADGGATEVRAAPATADREE